MIEAIPVTSCDGCGACCTYIGTPPGYASFFPVKGEIPGWAKDSDDWDYFRRMPESLRAELADYYRRVTAGEIEDRTARDDVPCLWYDPATRKCRHHQHRPSICREFDMGGKDCRRIRETHGITVMGVPVSFGVVP